MALLSTLIDALRATDDASGAARATNPNPANPDEIRMTPGEFSGNPDVASASSLDDLNRQRVYSTAEDEYITGADEAASGAAFGFTSTSGATAVLAAAVVLYAAWERDMI